MKIKQNLVLFFFGLFGLLLQAQPQAGMKLFRPTRGLNNGTDQGTANAGKDAWVYQENPNNLYDTLNILYSLPVSNCNSTHAWILIRFDLDSLPAQVDSVFAGFTHDPHTSYCYGNCSADWYFYKIAEDWEENSVTYSNTPKRGDTFLGPISISFPNDFGTREYNITSQYRRWKTGTDTNRGFAIYSPTVGCNNAAVGFYAHSSDDTAESKRPYLKIYYHQDLGQSRLEMITSVFPNPANSEITIHSGEALLKAEIFNVSGQKLCSGSLSGKQIKLPVNDIPNGFYYLKVTGINGSFTQKIAIYHW